ncbi:hypothetical protein [Streptomyces sp. enrichment culture]|uniref:hypothetical protein n=1 Tax=Streptomyces sp. enrichment culture TaxID=1795815 RepID=UPI003F56DCAD
MVIGLLRGRVGGTAARAGISRSARIGGGELQDDGYDVEEHADGEGGPDAEEENEAAGGGGRRAGGPRR